MLNPLSLSKRNQGVSPYNTNTILMSCLTFFVKPPSISIWYQDVCLYDTRTLLMPCLTSFINPLSLHEIRMCVSPYSIVTLITLCLTSFLKKSFSSTKNRTQVHTPSSPSLHCVSPPLFNNLYLHMKSGCKSMFVFFRFVVFSSVLSCYHIACIRGLCCCFCCSSFLLSFPFSRYFLRFTFWLSLLSFTVFCFLLLCIVSFFIVAAFNSNWQVILLYLGPA